MAYSELIKNFERVRSYMREFYVYGFRSREEYAHSGKSARTYDNERRRCESWLGEYMSFTRTSDGKSMFLSIDSRAVSRNPLYSAWKTASFTDADITLHFIIFDLLHSPEISMTLAEITEAIDNDYLSGFSEPMLYDESTVRKKLREYVEAGLIETEKQGRSVKYRRSESPEISGAENMLQFFSEAAPCGVIGSFLLDKSDYSKDAFTFKHHYMTQALDSDVLCRLFCAMREQRAVSVARCGRERVLHLVPLRIFVSTQSGRQHLMAFDTERRRLTSLRVDFITAVEPGEACDRFNELRARLGAMQSHIWGVSCNPGNKTEHVEFIVRYASGEEHIPRRLEREKRCGTVEHIDEHSCRFSADVYDSSELIPWIRTFICRITQLLFSNKETEARFMRDIDRMCEMYGLNGGDGNAVQ